MRANVEIGDVTQHVDAMLLQVELGHHGRGQRGGGGVGDHLAFEIGRSVDGAVFAGDEDAAKCVVIAHSGNHVVVPVACQ